MQSCVVSTRHERKVENKHLTTRSQFTSETISYGRLGRVYGYCVDVV